MKKDDRLLQAVQDVLRGQGLSVTARAYRISKSELSITVKAFKLCLNTSSNRGSAQKTAEKCILSFIVGCLFETLIILIVAWLFRG